jgi:hypothetical protein
MFPGRPESHNSGFLKICEICTTPDHTWHDLPFLLLKLNRRRENTPAGSSTKQITENRWKQFQTVLHAKWFKLTNFYHRSARVQVLRTWD